VKRRRGGFCCRFVKTRRCGFCADFCSSKIKFVLWIYWNVSVLCQIYSHFMISFSCLQCTAGFLPWIKEKGPRFFLGLQVRSADKDYPRTGLTFLGKSPCPSTHRKIRELMDF
jgi:hypothetical protein